MEAVSLAGSEGGHNLNQQHRLQKVAFKNRGIETSQRYFSAVRGRPGAGMFAAQVGAACPVLLNQTYQQQQLDSGTLEIEQLLPARWSTAKVRGPAALAEMDMLEFRAEGGLPGSIGQGASALLLCEQSAAISLAVAAASLLDGHRQRLPLAILLHHSLQLGPGILLGLQLHFGISIGLRLLFGLGHLGHATLPHSEPRKASRLPMHMPSSPPPQKIRLP